MWGLHGPPEVTKDDSTPAPCGRRGWAFFYNWGRVRKRRGERGSLPLGASGPGL